MQPSKTSTGTVEFELACECTTAKDALELHEMRANELSSELSKLNVCNITRN